MTPSQRLLIIIGGSLILLLLSVFIIYPIFRRDPAQTPVADTTTDIIDPSTINPLPVDSTPTANTGTTAVESEAPVATDASQRAEVERLSRLFVERFGSYSNFSNFENITSMEPFMTSTMLTYAQSLKVSQSNPTVGQYVGVTATVVSLTTSNFSASNTATVSFVINQETQNGLNAPIESAYRDGRLELEYVGGQWLVDGIFYNS